MVRETGNVVDKRRKRRKDERREAPTLHDEVEVNENQRYTPKDGEHGQERDRGCSNDVTNHGGTEHGKGGHVDVKEAGKYNVVRVRDYNAHTPSCLYTTGICGKTSNDADLPAEGVSAWSFCRECVCDSGLPKLEYSCRVQKDFG